MAGFTQKYHPFFKDSSSDFPPTSSTIKMLGFLEEPNNKHIKATPFSQVYQPEPFDDFPDNVCVHKTGACSPQGTKVINNGTTVCCTKIKCPKSSPNSDKFETTIIKQATQQVHSPIHNRRINNREVPSSISSQSNKSNMEEMRTKKQKKEIKKDKKATEEIASGYIHVRARRGQATDSHSLAERVRREKISERMKILQGLVPGCDKVNGKALMLDEIINYVQSLQHQVEFLSMKLATVNPIYYDFGLDIDTSMVTTEQRLTDMASPRPFPPPLPSSMQPCNATHQIPMPNSDNPLATSNIFGFLDNSASSLPNIQQELFPNISPRR
ncbi:hypothetical protein Leryth_016513 [Lithospermum erythrorhizon]|nr:hypothetical protein Leryth_016513 [Lithospermum erythrorhizon]